MKDYQRQDLLNLAYEMGVTIRSDADLIQFECEMILNGDLDLEIIQPQVKDNIDVQGVLDHQLKLIKDIHTSLFSNNSNNKSLTEDDNVKLTKANILLKSNKKERKKQ